MKRIIILFFVCMGLAAGGCARKLSEQEYLERAQVNLRSGKLSTAVIDYKNALRLNPENARTRLDLGTTYITLGDGESAEKELTRARSMGDKSEDLSLKIAESQLLQGQFTKVAQALETAPKSLGARRQLLLGTAYLGLSNPRAADRAFNEVLTSDPQSVEAVLGRARAALASNEQDKARVYIDTALKLEPNSLDGLFLKAEMLFRDGNFVGAVEIQQRLSTREDLNPPKKFAIYLALVRVALAQRELEQADKYLSKLMELAPRHPAPNYLRGTVALERGQLDNAKQYLETVLSTSPDHSPAQLLLGEIHYAMGNYAQAEEYLAAVIKVEPKNREAREYYAAVRLKQRRSKEAMAVLAPLLDKAEPEPRLLSLVGSAALLGQEFDSNVRFIRSAAQSADDTTRLKARLLLAQIAMARGQYKDAIQLIQTLPDSEDTRIVSPMYLIANYINDRDFAKARLAVKNLGARVPNDPVVPYFAGLVSLAEGDVPEARAQYAVALGKNATYLPALFGLAEMAANAGEVKEAIGQYEKIVAVDNKNISAMVGMARVYFFAGEMNHALEWLQRAQGIDEFGFDVCTGLTRLYLELNKEAKIEELLTRLARDLDSNAETLLGTADILLQAGRVDLALRAIQHLVRSGDVTPQLYAHVARVYVRKGDLETALNNVQQALNLDAQYIPARLLLAEIRLRQGKVDDAFAVASTLKKMGKNASATVLEGDLRMALGRYREADASYEKAMELEPSIFNLRKRAEAKKAQRDLDGLNRLYRTWIGARPKDTEARASFAAELQAQEKHREALEQLDFALTTTPGDPFMLNNKAWSMISVGDARALNFAKRAFDLRGSIPTIADTYAWILLTQSHVEQAVSLLERASRASGQDPDILFHLAVAYEKQGDVTKSKRVLESALQTQRDFSSRAQAIEMQKRIAR